MGKLSALQVLRLDDNSLSGAIPSEIGVVGDSLQLLSVAINHEMSGLLPSELGLLRGLIQFFAYETNTYGTIPTEIGGLPAAGSLTSFHVHDTPIYGEVPADLCLVDQLTFDCSGYLCGCSSCICGQQHVVTLVVDCRETPELCR